MDIASSRWDISSNAGVPASKAVPNPGSYLVTGASGALGSEVCEALLRVNGVENVLAIGRDAQKLEELAARTKSRVGRAPTLVQVDWEKSDTLQHLEIPPELVAGIVHCAGSYGEIGSLFEVEVDAWNESISKQLTGAMNTIKIAHELSARGHVSAVLLAGGGASQAYAGLSAYSIAKTGLVRMVETASLEIDSRRVSINALGPGPTNSQMVSVALKNRSKIDSRIVNASKMLVKNRDRGGREAFVSAVLWLLSAAGRNVSGRFLSSQWDDWPSLINSDRLPDDGYTLRRIIPQRIPR